MTEPLNQEVAEKYGYNEESFRGWTKTYVDSLKLDTLKFKPMNNKYVLYAKEKQGAFNNYLYLDERYIYLLEPNASKMTHYIPVSEPFHYQKKLSYSALKMNGLYVYKNGRHTYTNEGFNTINSKIIGVAPFPLTADRFLNWEFNPLEVKE